MEEDEKEKDCQVALDKEVFCRSARVRDISSGKMSVATTSRPRRRRKSFCGELVCSTS